MTERETPQREGLGNRAKCAGPGEVPWDRPGHSRPGTRGNGFSYVGWGPPSREAPPQEPYVRLSTHTARPQRPLKGTSFSEALE